MESIINLEAILNEFYHHSTSNFRKKEIEELLKKFQATECSAQICLQNLTNSFALNNQFLFFFSVSTLEFTITKKWFIIDKKLRIQIRDMLWYIYSNFTPNIGALQRDKLAQLIALIGKREFPSDHAEYVTQILSLTKMKFILGITLLKSTSHEICSTKIDCSHQQKSKFVQSMIFCLNDIMNLLGKFLTLCVCHVSNNELIVGPDIDFDLHSSLPNDERFVYCCTELLNTIASIFSWIPSNMENIMSPEFFNNIYELSTFVSEKYVNIHLSAIMTISELFYLQKQIPQIQIQANGITELIQQKNLQHAPEEYQDKLTELLKLFIQQQWSRFVNQPEFPSKEFLLYLFSFTFTDNISALTFGERLSLWIPIIKSFNEKTAPRYTETIVQLISNVLLKMQFSGNSELLDLLDTEEIDENMETELQTFRNNCIELILTASEIEPCKIFDLINHEFTKENGHLKNYVNLLNTLPDFSKELVSKTRVNINQIVRYSADPAFYLHCMTKDLTTLLQMITQTSNVILVISCDRNNSITNIIRTCILLLKLANQKKLHLYDLMDMQLKNDLMELQAQILSSVRGLMLLRTEIYENHNEIFELIDSVMQIILPSRYGFMEPHLVLNSAVQLMITITSVLRPNYFLKNALVQELFHSELSRFDEQIRLQIKTVVFNALVLPYSQLAVNFTEDQEYEKRGELLQQYVAFISYKFLSLNISSDLDKEEVRLQMKDYEHLLSSYEDTNNYSKQILLSAMNPVIKKSIEIFQFVAKQNYTQDEFSIIINFNLSIVKCLQVQLGSDFVINIVRLFLEIASTPNRSAHALNKLLEMLIFIVQHTGATSTHLMPDILKLTIDDLIRVDPQIDISFNLFSLYDSILQNHWHYFQKNSLPNGRNNQEDLMKIFTAYGQFLCNGSPIDPNICRVILSSLEKLNEKCHLYGKAFFKNSLLKSFMCTLLRVLISLEGILFYDQIITILFNMADKNKGALHECLAAVFTDKTKIMQLCEVSDLPTFANLMDILIQDTHLAHHQ